MSRFTRELFRVREFDRRRRPSERVSASLRLDADRAIVKLGNREFFVRSEAFPELSFDVHDFALFGLAIVSSTANIEIDFDGPVSRGAVDALRRLSDAIELWTLSSISKPCVNVSEVVDDAPRDLSGRRLLCMSGGVDSTAAAITAKAEGFTHGLLIAGADYPSSTSPGFVELQARVRRIAERIGLELIVAETDLRKLPFEWEMLHGLNLAMCLQFHASRFSGGGVGLDYPLEGELMYHPWGSSLATCRMTSLPHFPITGFNTDTDRNQKSKAIVDFDPDLLQHLSVCYADTSTGGNCGKCFKCLSARLRFRALGHDFDGNCVETPPLDRIKDLLSMPKDFRNLRAYIASLSALVRIAPPGPIGDALAHHVVRMRRRYVKLSPWR